LQTFFGTYLSHVTWRQHNLSIVTASGSTRTQPLSTP